MLAAPTAAPVSPKATRFKPRCPRSPIARCFPCRPAPRRAWARTRWTPRPRRLTRWVLGNRGAQIDVGRRRQCVCTRRKRVGLRVLVEGLDGPGEGRLTSVLPATLAPSRPTAPRPIACPASPAPPVPHPSFQALSDKEGLKKKLSSALGGAEAAPAAAEAAPAAAEAAPAAAAEAAPAATEAAPAAAEAATKA